ncbi:hypothetical protein FSA40_2068 (plasmid) [Streptococcus mutans]|nr:hypothetical protein FSA40_2068 [Streptococcus mutans]
MALTLSHSIVVSPVGSSLLRATSAARRGLPRFRLYETRKPKTIHVVAQVADVFAAAVASRSLAYR